MSTPKQATTTEKASAAAARARATITSWATEAATRVASIEHTDWSYFVGLFLIHDGLWREFGLGVANIAAGVVLVATPLLLILRKKA